MTAPNDATAAERSDRAPCGLLSTSADGTICHVNRTFCVWLGFDAEELIGKKRLQDLLTMGCKIFHQTHWLPLLQIQGSIAEVQLELVHRDGHALPVLVNAVVRRDADVEHDIAVFVATDRRKYERELLSARRQAEALLDEVRSGQEALTLAQGRLRLALESADLLVWSVEVASGTPLYERGVQRLLGMPDDARVDAELFRSCIHSEDRPAEAAAFAAALSASGDGSYLAEFRLTGFDGHERAVTSRGRGRFSEDGQLVGFSGVMQDVTQWRRAESALREQEQQARTRAVLAEQLVGIVSHDLRTPLNAVSVGASLLASGELSPIQARTVHRISAAVERAARLITDLLDFTQARLGGGLRVHARSVDLHALVADVIEELKLAWPGRMMEQRREGSGVGIADPERVAQAVTNLAANALTYGAPDRPIVLTSRTDDRNIVVQVHNHGPSISADLIPHIFEPLRRGDQQVKLGSRSVGLGLYIVREIAIAHGGQISVQSTPEEGTTFTLSLPQPAHA